MKPTITSFEVEDIGPDHAQYFRGRTEMLTRWHGVQVGTGSTAREAYNEALEMLAGQEHEGKEIDLTALPDEPPIDNPDADMPEEYLGEDSEFYYHVAIWYMIEVLALRKTFTSPYKENKHRIGQPFKFLGEETEPYDKEDTGTMYRIEFEDGVQITAWPEEITGLTPEEDNLRLVLLDTINLAQASIDSIDAVTLTETQSLFVAAAKDQIARAEKVAKDFGIELDYVA